MEGKVNNYDAVKTRHQLDELTPEVDDAIRKGDVKKISEYRAKLEGLFDENEQYEQTYSIGGYSNLRFELYDLLMKCKSWLQNKNVIGED